MRSQHTCAHPKFSRIPIIAVTGYGQEADPRRSRKAGIDHHLTKPVDPEALQAFIASARLAHQRPSSA
jgi:CheY-like chemotaxis protein